MRTPGCAIDELAKLVAEEPRLEAVAFETKRRRLSIATLGKAEAGRLSDAVEELFADRPEGCSQPDAQSRCTACGEALDAPSQEPRVVIKRVLGSTLIEKNTCPTAVSLWRWVRLKWPRYSPRTHPPLEESEKDEEWRWMAILAAGCLFFGLLGWLLDTVGLPVWAGITAYVLSYVCGAWDAAKDAWERVRHLELDVHFLMLAVAAGAAVIGAWREGALLLFLFSASGAMEHFAMGRTRKEISSLFRGAPKTARLLEDGVERQVAVAELVPGMRLLVTGGEQIPADLRVLEGETEVDESNLTGESRPVGKEKGDVLLAGTLNLWGAIEGEVLRPASESALERIIRLIREAQGLKAPSQRFTDRFGTGYTWAILSICAGMFLIWWLLLDLPPFVSTEETRSAFYRAMTLLVVASPCALVLSVPSAILSAIASGARRGILFRGGAAVETLAEVDVVALDKTGTLTTGELAFVGSEAVLGSEGELRGLAIAMARLSEHPLSRAIRRAAASWDAEERNVDHLHAVPGRGLIGRWKQQRVLLGSRAFAELEGRLPTPLPPPSGESAEVWVVGPGVVGRLLFRDTIRPEAPELLADLRHAGMRSVMLTGDHQRAAEQIAAEVGLDEVRAGLLPESKVAAVQELKKGGCHRVAMVGDGVNDAPCIAAADVGVAMGARGSDAALEQAEVVLMNDKLENFLRAKRLSVRARRIIYQNVFVALGTVCVMVCTTFFLPVPLALGVAAHEGSTLLVVLNSLRLLYQGRP